MEHSKEAHVTTGEIPESPPPVYHRPSLWHRFEEFLNTFWIIEIVACLLSLVMLAAIFGLLKHYNSWIVDLWSHSWSLNSLVGFLATLSQIFMAVPLASAISQLKWTWYRQSHKLTDLDKFDKSSRGPLGSVGLIFSRPFKFLGALGAMLTILSVAFHTLIQQAISTRVGLYQLDNTFSNPDSNISEIAFYPQGNAYNLSMDYSSGQTLGDQGPWLDMVADINYGMFYTTSAFVNQYQSTGARCFTGNCTWAHVQSLSVCTQCADVSSYIGSSSDGAYYTLYDFYLRKDIGLVTTVGETTYPDSKVLQNIGPLIVHWAAMVRASTAQAPVGIDCALYWCVQERNNVTMRDYKISYETITYETDLSVSGQTKYQQDQDITITPTVCYNDTGYPVEDLTLCTKTVTANAQLGLQNFFTSKTQGFTGTAMLNLPTHGWNISSEFVQLLFSTATTSTHLLADYQQILTNIGVMITDNIRRATNTPQGEFPGVWGETDQWVTLFHIRWGYLIVPTLLVVGSIIFLFVTIFKSWGQEKWKASLLPLLFHPLHEDHKPVVAPHRIADLKTIAENNEVKLERGHAGSQFV